MHPTIKLFGEKVDRLEQSSLWRFIQSPGWHVFYNSVEGRPGDESRMPDTEHIEAYVLNLRFFLQDREPTSLRNMAEFYRIHCKDPALIARFDDIRMVINDDLDRPFWFRINDKQVTWRAILNGMLYSKFSHADTKTHHLFTTMTEHPFAYALAMDGFLRCIVLLHTGLRLIRQLNEAAFASN